MALSLANYSLAPSATKAPVQPSLGAQDVITAIQTGLQRQGIVSVGGNAGNIYQKPSNVTITFSGSTTTAQKILNQNTVYTNTGGGTWTFSDATANGKQIDYMISAFAGRVFLDTLSFEAVTSAAAQDGSAIASANLTYTNYDMAGGILGQVIISNTINPLYYQAGSVIYDLKSSTNPYGLAVLPTTSLSFVPVSGDKYTAVLSFTIVQ